jgi:ribosomal protein S12 methylthiotransferase
MGCSKNLVDSETLMAQLEANGYKVTHDTSNPQGEIAVINTCGFIESAKQESINMILEFAQRKDEGQLNKLFVMGCLSQRYSEQLQEEIPQVDKFYPKFNFRELITDLGKAYQPSCEGCRHLTTPHHYAYLKISEGCDRNCAYCAIPLMTGPHLSRKEDDILNEVRNLVKSGVKEFQVIAQELTYYGVDIYGEQRIAELIAHIADIKGVEWIRLHYAYPNHFPYELLKVMRERDNVCRYLDIALQHISDNVLVRMRRNTDKAETMELIRRLRAEVPGIHIRTTLMVGFPGETEEDFQELVEFVRWARFERMGAFMYSEEEGTYSAEHYKDDVPPDVKQRRLDELMSVQQEISADIEASKIGSIMRVIVDRKEGSYYIARSEFCSPEVDPEVLIEASGRSLHVGRFYNVKITGSEEFDLYAELVK